MAFSKTLVRANRIEGKMSYFRNVQTIAWFEQFDKVDYDFQETDWYIRTICFGSKFAVLERKPA